MTAARKIASNKRWSALSAKFLSVCSRQRSCFRSRHASDVRLSQPSPTTGNAIVTMEAAQPFIDFVRLYPVCQTVSGAAFEGANLDARTTYVEEDLFGGHVDSRAFEDAKLKQVVARTLR